MLQVGRDAYLGQEPLDAEDGAEFRIEHLDGDGAVVAEVVGEVVGGHAAGADLAVDAVAVGECRGQAVLGFTHAVRCGGANAVGPGQCSRLPIGHIGGFCPAVCRGDRGGATGGGRKLVRGRARGSGFSGGGFVRMAEGDGGGGVMRASREQDHAADRVWGQAHGVSAWGQSPPGVAGTESCRRTSGA